MISLLDGLWNLQELVNKCFFSLLLTHTFCSPKRAFQVSNTQWKQVGTFKVKIPNHFSRLAAYIINLAKAPTTVTSCFAVSIFELWMPSSAFLADCLNSDKYCGIGIVSHICWRNNGSSPFLSTAWLSWHWFLMSATLLE